eukprot:4276107-Prymnesium_polylepis.1
MIGRRTLPLREDGSSVNAGRLLGLAGAQLCGLCAGSPWVTGTGRDRGCLCLAPSSPVFT